MEDWTINPADVKSDVDGNFVLYRNRPLVREDNIICYGNMSDKYILQMIIMTEKEVKGNKIPDQIYIQLLKTDPTLQRSERVVKEGMKSGLSEALDIGIAWLERYLNS